MTDAKNGGGETSSTTPADQSHVDSTRNQDDAQNTTATKNESTEEVATSKMTSKANSTRNSSPAATHGDNEEAAQSPGDAPSGTETKQGSRESTVASEKPAPSLSKESDESGAAPYGTRSRNRPGRSRPTINYAEDTEMDFEMTAAPMNGDVSEPPSHNSVVAENVPLTSGGGKKGAGGAQSNASWGNSGSNPKDNLATANISGTSAVTAANPASTVQPATKRRKNAVTTNGNHASAAAPSQTGPKRGNQVTIAANSARETNMMTFENTGAMLKNGHMEADDGQILSVNGKF